MQFRMIHGPSGCTVSMRENGSGATEFASIHLEVGQGHVNDGSAFDEATPPFQISWHEGFLCHVMHVGGTGHHPTSNIFTHHLMRDRMAAAGRMANLQAGHPAIGAARPGEQDTGERLLNDMRERFGEGIFADAPAQADAPPTFEEMAQQWPEGNGPPNYDTMTPLITQWRENVAERERQEANPAYHWFVSNFDRLEASSLTLYLDHPDRVHEEIWRGNRIYRHGREYALVISPQVRERIGLDAHGSVHMHWHDDGYHYISPALGRVTYDVGHPLRVETIAAPPERRGYDVAESMEQLERLRGQMTPNMADAIERIFRQMDMLPSLSDRLRDRPRPTYRECPHCEGKGRIQVDNAHRPSRRRRVVARRDSPQDESSDVPTNG